MDNGPGISPPFAILKVNDHWQMPRQDRQTLYLPIDRLVRLFLLLQNAEYIKNDSELE